MSSLSINPPAPPSSGIEVQDFHSPQSSRRAIFPAPVSPTSEVSNKFSRAGGMLGFKTGPSRKKATQVTPSLLPPHPSVEAFAEGSQKTTLQPRSGSTASTDTVTLQDPSAMPHRSAPVHAPPPPPSTSTHYTPGPLALNTMHSNTARSSTS